MSQNLPERSWLYVILTISYLRAQKIETSSLPTDSLRPLFKQIEIFSILTVWLCISTVSTFLNIRTSYWSASSGFRLPGEIPAGAITLLFVYTATGNSFVIFTCRYFKLSWNTTALSQSNCRNFSCSSITQEKLRGFRIPFHGAMHLALTRFDT